MVLSLFVLHTQVARTNMTTLCTVILLVFCSTFFLLNFPRRCGLLSSGNGSVQTAAAASAYLQGISADLGVNVHWARCGLCHVSSAIDV